MNPMPIHRVGNPSNSKLSSSGCFLTVHLFQAPKKKKKLQNVFQTISNCFFPTGPVLFYHRYVIVHTKHIPYLDFLFTTPIYLFLFLFFKIQNKKNFKWHDPPSSWRHRRRMLVWAAEGASGNRHPDCPAA